MYFGVNVTHNRRRAPVLPSHILPHPPSSSFLSMVMVLFRQVPRQAYEEDVKMSYSISPVSQSTRLLSKPSKAKRKIPKIPFKVGYGEERDALERRVCVLSRSRFGCVRVAIGTPLLSFRPKVEDATHESHKRTFPLLPVSPTQVLDAPQLQDDFYLNLVDWSSLNVLAVGLGACVYLWSACTSKVCSPTIGCTVEVYFVSALPRSLASTRVQAF